MPTIARIIGGAGCGKTTDLLNTMEKVLAAGTDILDVGFVSFTRAARDEALGRAAERFNHDQSYIEKNGWFKTLHQICYRKLGIGKELVTDDADGLKWISEAVGEAVGTSVYDALIDCAFDATTQAGVALNIWNVSRNKLEPFEDTYNRVKRYDERVPEFGTCLEVVQCYEQAKRLDGRCDFADILGRYSGWRFDIQGPTQTEPEGDVPAIEAWFLDEQQDTTRLLDAVCRRLIAPARWAYVVGDPFQAIYGWAGADASVFMGWKIATGMERTLQKSYRCPQPMIDLGERILQRCSDYFDRGIVSACEHPGAIEMREFSDDSIFSKIDPTESWLLIARTNRDAARIEQKIQKLKMPWVPVKGNGGWRAPARIEICKTFWALQNGLVVRPLKWKQAIAEVPTKFEGKEMLPRGVKQKWKTIPAKELTDGEPIVLDELPDATPDLISGIRRGNWMEWINRGSEFNYAMDKWGEELIENPRIKIGTIHSVKGAEADNVIWLTALNNRIRTACIDQENRNEERRVAYVAATRARKRLIMAIDRGSLSIGDI